MDTWKRTLIPPSLSLAEAIEVLDRAALRIALVTDSERRLLGTLTDGDVRRALIRRVPLDASVLDAMCSEPKVAREDWSADKILEVMSRMKLLHLPIVDSRQRVVGLETIHGLLAKPKRDNPVFLMAGGFGKRLHPLTSDCPKPLLKIGGKPILERILKSFVSAGFYRYFISTHYLPEMISDYFGDGSRWGVSIHYVHEKEPLGTGGALGLLPHQEIRSPLILMNGDLLTTLDYESLLEFHEIHPAVATMCVREYEHQVPYGVIQSDGPRVKSMIEKPVKKFFVNAGIYALSPEFVKSVEPNTPVDMPTLLERELRKGRNVNMFPLHEYWLDIGRMDDYRRAQSEVRDRFDA